MAKDSVTFSKFTGIKNTVAEERLSPAELAYAINVDIDDSGQIRRRRGFDQKASGNYHSVFSSGDSSYVVKNGDLCRLFPNYTTTVIKAGVGPNEISYVRVGDDIYFSSKNTSGIIRADNTVDPWGEQDGDGRWLSPVVNPTQYLAEVGGKLLGNPPNSTSLSYHNGRIYMADDKTVWATELYLYQYVDKTKNYLYFEAPVTGIMAVTDGQYVGTESAVYFISGPFNEMRRIKVADAGMVRGSLIDIPADLVRGEGSTRNAVMFMTNLGIFVGLDGGLCYNLTQSRVEFPKAIKAASMFRQQDGINQYISVADSAGSPTSSARIGDYVDAEIRRFKGA
jgi:hypothetical protein